MDSSAKAQKAKPQKSKKTQKNRKKNANVNNKKPQNQVKKWQEKKPPVATSLNVHNMVQDTAILGTAQLKRQQRMDMYQLNIAAATFWSRIVATGAQMSTDDDDFNTTFVVEGLAVLVRNGLAYAQGAEFGLPTVPWIWEVIFSLLTAKTVRVGKEASIRYTADFQDHWELEWTINLPIGSRYTFYVPQNVYETWVTLPTGSIETENGPQARYAALTSSIQSLQGTGFKLLSMAKVPNRLYHRDPSAFCRTYTYYGSCGEGAGTYVNTELEVPFNYPQFGKFVPYVTDDQIISRYFLPQSGGLNVPVGLSLTMADYDYPLLKNPIPVRYKCIDFMEFIDYMSAWLIAVFNYNSTFLNAAPENNLYVSPEPLAMSYTNFIWLMRQVICAVFTEQCHAQFVAPVKSTPSAQNAVFQPLIVDGVLTPTRQFLEVKLPTFIAENLCMLRQVAIPIHKTKQAAKFGTVPKKLCDVTVPVWGYYTGAIPAVPQYTGSDGELTPIFAVSDDAAEQCWFDGVFNGKKYNPNAAIAGLIGYWNNWVSTLGAQVSSVTAPTVDVAKLSLLHYTRVKEYFVLDSPKKVTSSQGNVAVKQFVDPYNKYWQNFEPRTYSEGKHIRILPPATNSQLITRELNGLQPFKTDSAAALEQLIIPFIRYEPGQSQNDDILTKNNYLPYTLEYCQYISSYSSTNTIPKELTRLQQAGSALARAKASNTNTGDAVVSAVEYVQKHGLGADFLQSILGGLSSLVPIVGPVLSSVISSI